MPFLTILCFAQINSHHQATFVNGRTIQQHFALAHELFQQLIVKVKGGTVCIKLDIPRAFYKIHWGFHLKALHFFKFSPSWISMIRELISTSSGFVLINKTPCGLYGSTDLFIHMRTVHPFLLVSFLYRTISMMPTNMHSYES